ncbi:NADP-dependent oxidoreductase [Nocardioides anomalus]|uniref:NADP-dependent oxidoreductase n=1 Tax=Nocardioides anomalus TaxID=2712223 RepID=UPI001E4A3386|nr:NADP-dependent oxidoreductase [Nocardioides anomalus]
MKAVRFHDYGDPDVLRYEDVDRPEPGAGQVRVAVAATSFNGVDATIRAGFMQGPIPVTLPHTPGLDVAGTVDALGEGVTGFSVGDPVIGFLPMTEDGAAAEHVLAPADVLSPAPTTLPLADAAALPVVALTARQALFVHADLRPGQRILVNGAGGAVGGTPCSWRTAPAPTSSPWRARRAPTGSVSGAPTRSSTTPPGTSSPR